MSKPRLILDLTQFISLPARSGIQRVLTELIGRWPADLLDADAGVLQPEGYRLMPLDQAARLMRAHFSARGEADLAASFLAASNQATDALECAARYSGFFLPEPTFRRDVLDVVRDQMRRARSNVFALIYDALPQIEPQVFPLTHQLATSRYYRLVASLDNIACISAATLDTMERRLRRRRFPNATVIRPGADTFRGARTRAPGRPNFVMIGTVEPRKNHRLVLAAFDQLWRSGEKHRLTVIGSRGWHESEFLHELEARARTEPERLLWLQTADDEQIRASLADATGAIFVSELEGYGLPAVEALAAGCPLLASEHIPALDGLAEAGQIRLGKVTPQAIAAAVQRMADPRVNARMSAAAARLPLPTWDEFAVAIAGWIRDTLDQAGAARRRAAR